MGQRSQLYIKIDHSEKHIDKSLIAEYLQWNYMERMISRASATLSHTLNNSRSLFMDFVQDKLRRVMDTNFDMGDIQLGQDLVEEYINESYIDKMKYDAKDFQYWVFDADNNDGRLMFLFTIVIDAFDAQ